MAIDLVRAINVDRQLTHIIGVKNRNAQCLQALRAGLRTGHRALDLVFDARQRVDEFVDGGTRAHAHNLTFDNILQRRLADQGFEFILGHLRQSMQSIC